MAKKILCLTPPYHTGIIEITGKWPPLSLLYLAGALRKHGHDVEVYDIMTKNHEFEEIKLNIIDKKPDIVLIGAFTSSINAAVETLKVVKEIDEKIVTCLGGVHATFCYEELMTNSFIDFIIRGEGEETIAELVNAIELDENNYSQINGLVFRDGKNIVTNEKRTLINDLDSLEPAWDLLNWEDYHYRITDSRLALISSSRGCDHECKFCSQHKFWDKTYRERSAENLLQEIIMLNQKYGVTMCLFSDEYATKNRVRWEKFLDLIIEKDLGMFFTMETRVADIIRDKDILWKYREAGFIHVYVGVESTSQDKLDEYKKELTIEEGKEGIRLLNEAGIITECSFILGGPDESPEKINETLSLALEYNPDLAHFLLITPWPYSDIYEDLKDYIVEVDYSKYHFVHPIIKPKNMTVEEVMNKLVDCFRVFYSSKIKQYTSMEDSFKKRYMMRAIEIMQKEFFFTNFGHKKLLD
jgi:anaerobic magnesium-protoporphyrin IX monomethyl ester cyclase